MHTRNQKRAASAFERVSRLKDELPETEHKKYGAMAHKLPVLIRQAGLVQALVFVDSRGTDADSPYRRLLEDVAQTAMSTGRKQLLEQSRTENLASYMVLTREVLAACVWYKRFAQSVLGVEADAAADGEERT